MNFDDKYTHGRTPLEEGSARRRSLYLRTHNIHNRQISTTPAEFQTEIPASERSQTDALDRVTTRKNTLASTFSQQSYSLLHSAWNANRTIYSSSCRLRSAEANLRCKEKPTWSTTYS